MKLSAEDRLYFKSNKVLNEHVFKLLSAHVKKYRKLNVKKRGYQKWSEAKHPVMNPKLAELILILIKKVINSPKFMYYTQDWRDDFQSNATLLLMKYCHNFKVSTKNAIGYLYMSIENACIQELNLKKKQGERMAEVSLNTIRESDLVAEQEFDVNLM